MGCRGYKCDRSFVGLVVEGKGRVVGGGEELVGAQGSGMVDVGGREGCGRPVGLRGAAPCWRVLLQQGVRPWKRGHQCDRSFVVEGGGGAKVGVVGGREKAAAGP